MFDSIDATLHDSRLMRFVNDAPRRSANCVTKAILVDGQPHVMLFACCDIEPGDEIVYDYKGGDLWWRQVSCKPFTINLLGHLPLLTVKKLQAILCDLMLLLQWNGLCLLSCDI